MKKMFKRMTPLAWLLALCFILLVIIAAKPAGITHLTSLWVGDATDTADVTPGVNDLFVSGTVEIDGATRIDGALTTIGQTVTGDLDVSGEMRAASFVIDTIKDYTFHTGGDITLTTADRGYVFDNEGASTTATFQLPTESIEGAAYFFILKEAHPLAIAFPSAQILLGATNASGDVYCDIAGTIGDHAEFIYIGDDRWILSKSRGTWTDQDG